MWRDLERLRIIFINIYFAIEPLFTEFKSLPFIKHLLYARQWTKQFAYICYINPYSNTVKHYCFHHFPMEETDAQIHYPSQGHTLKPIWNFIPHLTDLKSMSFSTLLNCLLLVSLYHSISAQFISMNIAIWLSFLSTYRIFV